jgi:hypothetical protein
LIDLISEGQNHSVAHNQEVDRVAGCLKLYFHGDRPCIGAKNVPSSLETAVNCLEPRQRAQVGNLQTLKHCFQIMIPCLAVFHPLAVHYFHFGLQPKGKKTKSRESLAMADTPSGEANVTPRRG